MMDVTRLDGSSPLPDPEPPPGSPRAPRRHAETHGAGCPACGCCDSRVIYVRPAFGKKTMRRRECRYCGRRYSTYETVVGQN